MEKKKIIKFIWGAIAVGLLTFASVKACKNNDFSAVKTLTSEKALPTRAERINAPKRANAITWNDINSWEDVSNYDLKVKKTVSSYVNRFMITTINRNLPFLKLNTVDYYQSAYKDDIIYFNSDSNGGIGAIKGGMYPNDYNPITTDLQLNDIVRFYTNINGDFSTLKTALINTFDIVQEETPPTATLELDLTNLTNFDLSAIYLDNNEFPLSSNIIDLTTLSDGEHTLTFYDAQNDNCFNSSIQTIYSGWGSSLFQPLSSTTFSNNSDYRGQMVFTWDSSLLSENKAYKITLSGKASYNFNYLTGKSFILNAELPYLKQAGERWWLDAKDTETTYFVYNYSNSSLPVKAVARTEGVDAIHGNYLIFGNNQDSSLIFGEYPIYAHQINAYENEYGVPPRLISFLSTFNNENMNNFYYSYNGAVANIVGDYMYSANLVDYLVANSTELTTDQFETYQSGYNSGYNEGIKNIYSLSNLIYNFFKGIDDALSIEIIPNVQIKYIIYIPLVLSIVKFILGWFR